MNEWQTSAPPNETLVEVEDGGDFIQVMAFYGRDGHRPHWTTKDGGKVLDVRAFKRWRAIAEADRKVRRTPAS
jgi:hypothetical protein